MGLTLDVTNESNKYDTLIVGAGVGALTAAIYCQRAGLKTGFFEYNVPGGKIVNNPTIENVPGYKTINGADLAYSIFEQATQIGANYLYGKVTGIVKKDNHFLLYTEDGQTWQSMVVIIASGTIDERLNVPGEEEYLYKGISQCAICDGSLVKGKEICIIGGGSSAFNAALYLSNIATKVNIIHRRESFRAEQILIDKAKQKENISFMLDTIVTGFKGDGKNLNQVEIKNTKTNTQETINMGHAFVYIGSKANTEFVPQDLSLDENKFIITNRLMETNIEGLYAVGDCVSKLQKQIVTSMGEGATAAMNAIAYVDKKK